MRVRLAAFAVALHPEKTRLIEFGRHAGKNRSGRGEGKPETFDFLGFTHICGKTRSGGFQLWRKTERKRMKAKIKAIKDELRRRMHTPLAEKGRGSDRWCAASSRISAFRYHVVVAWVRTLRRRSQRHRLPWERMQVHLARYIPKARVLHP
jgi:RNA-directed DNA polymerase